MGVWFAEAQISVSDAVRVLAVARKEEALATVVGKTALEVLQVTVDEKLSSSACCALVSVVVTAIADLRLDGVRK